MNMNVMKKMMMAGAVCVALCGSSFAGANQKMVVHSDKRQGQQYQMQQHKVQQKHVVKQKQVVVVQKYDKCRHNRHDCRECYRKARPNQPGGKVIKSLVRSYKH